MARVESEKVVERRKVAVASAPRSGYVRAMRLYSGKVPAIAAEVTRALLAGKDIESATPKEVEADIASVLTQYLADEKAVNERAKDLIERTGKSQADYSRLRALAAEERDQDWGRSARLRPRSDRLNIDALGPCRGGVLGGCRPTPQDGTNIQETHGSRREHRRGGPSAHPEPSGGNPRVGN